MGDVRRSKAFDLSQDFSMHTPARWSALLDDYDRAVREETERYGGRLVKFTGDGSLASFDSPGGAIRSAEATIAAVNRLGIEIRVGVHTGEVEVRGDDVGGIAVHIGARVMAAAWPGERLGRRSPAGDWFEHHLRGPGARTPLRASKENEPLRGGIGAVR